MGTLLGFIRARDAASEQQDRPSNGVKQKEGHKESARSTHNPIKEVLDIVESRVSETILSQGSDKLNSKKARCLARIYEELSCPMPYRKQT